MTSLLAFAFIQSAALDRTVFVRGEQIRVVASSNTDGDIDGLQKAHVEGGGAYVVETAKLAPGEYTLRLGTFVKKVTVVDPPNPERFPVWKWGGTAPKSFAYFRDRGFTGVSSSMITAAPDPAAKQTVDIKKSLDEAARFGLDYGIYVNPLFDPRWKSEAGVQAELYNGNKIAKPYPRNPIVRGFAEEAAQGVAKTFREYPAWKHSLLGSEFQLDYNFGASAVQLGQQEASVDVRTAAIIKQPVENLPKGGLIEDDNPRYRYLKWWFHRGMGDASVNAAMSQILKGARKDILTWHDPFRLAPVLGSADGLDAISTWTYCQPDMTRLLFTRVLQAAARPEGQKVMQTITLFQYPQFVESVQGAAGSLENDKPGGNDFYTAGPDFAREAVWLTFSQRPDILSFYYGGVLQPDDPNVDKRRASPETFDAIGEVVRDLVEPYGPALLTGKPESAKVAVLLSAAAIWMGDPPKNPGYPNEQILPYCSLLAMNHVPFDVVFDDDVVSGRLALYDCLVMPQAGALTRSMFNKIKEFASSGKKVIADKSLAAPVPGAILTDYDFTFQRKVDGVELSKGMAVTADESRSRMEAFAADLSSKIGSFKGAAFADSPRAIVNTVVSGQVRYVFVVNDNRTYGPRFGSAKLNLDQGAPLTAKVNVGQGVAFDALTGAQMSGSSFQAELPAAGGKLYIVLPNAPGDISVSVPTDLKEGIKSAIVASVAGVKGSVPIRVEVKDPTGQIRLNWCVAARDGRGSVPFIPAENDPKGTYTITATNLVNRKTATAGFTR